MAIFTRDWRSGAPEKFVQLGVDIDVLTLVTRCDDLIGPGQERSSRTTRRLEVSLAEGGGERDVQQFAAVLIGGPYLDVAFASRTLQADCQQVTGKDPLDRLVRADM